MSSGYESQMKELSEKNKLNREIKDIKETIRNLTQEILWLELARQSLENKLKEIGK